jgi:hypothetical protein
MAHVVLFVVGGVELNPDPTVEQEKLDQIVTHVRNQERGREQRDIKKAIAICTITKLEK